MRNIYQAKSGVGVYLADDPEFDLAACKTELPALTPTAEGKVFDGVIRNARIYKYCAGYVFGCSRFEDGCAITTSEVVAVAISEPFGRYVETKGRSRYLIGVSSLSQEALDLFSLKEKQIAESPNYFQSKQWSDTLSEDSMGQLTVRR